MLRNCAIAIILSLASATSAARSQESPLPPFLMAHAYAIAIDEFCFEGTNITTSRLLSAARDLRTYVGTIVDDHVRAAREHLRSDPSACAGARALVARYTTDEAYASIKTLLSAYQKNAAD